jgi:isocitrate dehydrogenase (NAD+)
MLALRSIAAPVQRQCFRAAPRRAVTLALQVRHFAGIVTGREIPVLTSPFQNRRLYSSQDAVAKFNGQKDAQVSNGWVSNRRRCSLGMKITQPSATITPL